MTTCAFVWRAATTHHDCALPDGHVLPHRCVCGRRSGELMPRTSPLTSREVLGVLAGDNMLVYEYIERLYAALDDTDGEDSFGTEGWRRYLLGEDD